MPIDLSQLPDRATVVAPSAAIMPPAKGGLDLSQLPDQALPRSPVDRTLAAAVTTQLQRQDLPDDVRAELSGIANGTSPRTGQSEILNNLRDLFLGARSGLATSAYHTGAIIRRALGMPQVIDQPGAQAAMTAPASTLGAVGKVGEQTAEFIAPATAATDLVKGTQIAARLVKAGVSVERARMAAGLVEGTAQGATAYGVTKAQGESSTAAGINAAISGVLPIAGAGLELAYPRIKRSAVQKMQAVLSSAYKPENITDYVNKVTTQAARDALNVPLQTSWKQWRVSSLNARRAAGNSLRAGLDGGLGAQVIDQTPVINALQDLSNTRAEHLVLAAGDDGHLLGKTIAYNKPLASAIDALQDTLKEYPPGQMTVRQLHDIKRVWDAEVFPLTDARNPVASPGDLLTSVQKEARIAGTDAIRRVFDDAAPSISKLDDAASHAIRLNQLVRRLQGKAKLGGTSTQLLYGAAMTGGYAASRVLGGGYGAHMLGSSLGLSTARMLKGALESPGWKTLSSVLRDRLADAIATGQVRQIRRIVAPLLSASVAQASGLITGDSGTSDGLSSTTAP